LGRSPVSTIDKESRALAIEQNDLEQKNLLRASERRNIREFNKGKQLNEGVRLGL
jgi:hypothetical protein